MNIAIVTPWHNHTELWPAYKAVIAERKRGDEVWIIDNGSKPPLDFSTMHLNDNRGFCGGSNAGLEAANTDAVVFLNNDVELVNQGWLDTLRSALEPGVLVGARMRQDLHAAVGGMLVPYLDGWCLAGMRQDLLDLGGFDETLTEPAYYSDNLLCLEARAAGMELVEIPVGLRHLEGTTSDPGSNIGDVGLAARKNRARYVDRASELLVPAT